MHKTAAVLLLIAACFGPSLASAADLSIMPHRHFARGCGFHGRVYLNGQFCTLACNGLLCATQTCHHGRWVIPPATCPLGSGCSAFC